MAKARTSTERPQKDLHTLESRNDYLEREVAELTERNRELQDLINHHPITALPIRRIMDRDLERLLKVSEGLKKKCAVIILRLDHSYAKIRNNRDRNKVLLYKTVLRIQEIEKDKVYQSDRVDEFFIILDHLSNGESAIRTARKILETVTMPHEPPAEDISFGCHMGIAIFPDHAATKEALLGNADIALTESEKNGEGYILYNDTIGKRYREDDILEKELSAAIHNGFKQFHLAYQAFVDTRHKIRGAEALIRWNHPKLGNIPPSRFIPIAEESGDIRFLGHWILYHACKHLAGWHKAGHKNIYVSVNLSPSQFKQMDIVERVTGIMDSLKLEGRFLKLELTEGTVMSDPEDAIIKMEELRKNGIHISIDDFGTGYSSLNYLKRFPISTLKIDKSFIDDLCVNINNQEIVKAIISMARNLRIETLAEGVEAQDQLSFLFNEGCEFIQGYFFSKPVPAKVFSHYLAKGAKLPFVE